MKHKDRFWGIVFILAAVFILLGNYGFFREISMTRLFLALLLLYFITKNIPCRNFYGILIPAACILILYDNELHITRLTPFPILAAAVFGSIGLSFLFPNQPPFHSGHFFDFEDKEGKSHCRESDISCGISFGGTSKYIDADNFCRAYLKCTFGSLKAYFDHAKIAGGSAEIYVENAFGEISLFLPKEWNVSVEAATSFGDIEEIHKSPYVSADAPVVIVRGTVSFGDCKIYYV